MKINLNELEIDVEEGTYIFHVKEKYKKNADIIILNGFPIEANVKLKNNDKVILIKRGEFPKKHELESLMMARHTPGVFEKLKNAKVAIAGCGGLGSNIAISLARVGIGNLIICDFDIVEPSNLNRQQYFVSDIGKFKVCALEDILLKINPFINIEKKKVYLDERNIEKILKDSDIVIEAFDKAECKANLANIVLTKMKDKYLITASGMAGYFDSNIIKTKKINEKFFVCGDFINETKIGSGLMAPRVAICANHMANEAVRILCKNL
ncbi:MAG: sulfur carrier protein ThiS adenylyltransferase ThiF [Clostridium perfringens]|nr:sulfur carrier protein ThiS adenylyltransferase ThiF [Clostridium perfringens]